MTLPFSRDKTVSHLHTDPKLIKQTSAKSSLSVGQFVYLDYDGIYKPAIATSKHTSNVQGYVWSFVGDDAFYLKIGVGPLKYRFPLTKDFYNTSVGGRIDEFSVKSTKIPGNLGDRLYLSETVAGALQTHKPVNFVLLLGYKTEYGMIYRPNALVCCGVDKQCEVSMYDMFHYTYDCSGKAWTLDEEVKTYLYEAIPCSILNSPLMGRVQIAGSDKKYVTNVSGTLACLSVSGAGSFQMSNFDYQMEDNKCKRTYIEPLLIMGNLDAVFNVVNNGVSEIVPISGQAPSATFWLCHCCPVSGSSSSSSSSSSSYSSSSSFSSSSSSSISGACTEFCVYTFNAHFDCTLGWQPGDVTVQCLSGSAHFDTGWQLGNCDAVRTLATTACCMISGDCPSPFSFGVTVAGLPDRTLLCCSSSSSSLSSLSSISSASISGSSSSSSRSSSISGSSSSSSSSAPNSCYYYYTNTYDACNSNAWQGAVHTGTFGTCSAAGAAYAWRATANPCVWEMLMEVPGCVSPVDCSPFPIASPANPAVNPPPGCGCSSSSSSSSAPNSCYYRFDNTYDPCNSHAWQGAIHDPAGDHCDPPGMGNVWTQTSIFDTCTWTIFVEVPNTNCAADGDCVTVPTNPGNPPAGTESNCLCPSSSSSSSAVASSSSSQSSSSASACGNCCYVFHYTYNPGTTFWNRTGQSQSCGPCTGNTVYSGCTATYTIPGPGCCGGLGTCPNPNTVDPGGPGGTNPPGPHPPGCGGSGSQTISLDALVGDMEFE